MGNKEIWTERYGPINENYRGDFIGFTWDGMSMSRLNVVRMSGGDRFNESLLATMQDKTTQVPGRDGTYYFGSWYTAKPFSIQIAFEKLTELQIRQLKQLFGDKGIHRLSFDEQPYKEYLVKCTGTPQLKYIPFDDEAEDIETEITNIYSPGTATKWTNRIYKGEGTLTFTAYCPYARSRATTLEALRGLDQEDNDENKDVYNEDVYLDNESQWALASGLNKVENFVSDSDENGQLALHNCGDIKADYLLSFDPNDLIGKKLIIDLWKKEEVTNPDDTFGPAIGYRSSLIDSLTLKFPDTFKLTELSSSDSKVVRFQINSRAELIEGIDEEDKITGYIYNNLIEEGRFFKLPTQLLGEDYYIYARVESQASESGTTTTTPLSYKIKYDYWYY